MSSRSRVAVIASVIVLVSVLAPGTPSVWAFTEGPTNSFFGQGAGDNPESTGTNNSFFGVNAGTSNTSGTNNAFFGLNSGLRNTSGSENSFFGTGSGGFNTTGGSNSFFGREAGLNNTSGVENAFFGRDAGRSNTTGPFNAFFGESAGRANTTGFSNAFFGRNAGRNNIAGANNSFFGQHAGSSNTSSHNAFFGFFAGSFNTSGGDNAFFGGSAGLSNTTESGNTFVGAGAQGVPGVTNATAIGNDAQVSGANRLVLGSVAGLNSATQNVNVGIGTPSPAEPLHVRRTDGTAKVLVQEASGTTLGRELFELVNNGAARFRVRNTSNNATWDFQSSSGGGSFVIDRVGGPASLDFELQPDGDAVFRGRATATAFITSSDRNLKTEITPANTAKLMSLLRQLDISTWRFKTEREGTVKLGPMAQDFHRLFGMGTETTIDIRDLAALALLGVQALDRRLTEVETAN